MPVATRTDTDIKKDALDELDWDPQVEATEVGVEVDSGVAGSWPEKRAAAEAAWKAKGLTGVANDIEIRPG